MSPHPIKNPRSPRNIRDTTRQTLERSMQIASANYSADDWSRATSQGEVVGDIMWKLGNMLWRIFAQVSLASRRRSDRASKADAMSASITYPSGGTHADVHPYRAGRRRSYTCSRAVHPVDRYLPELLLAREARSQAPGHAQRQDLVGSGMDLVSSGQLATAEVRRP